MEILKYWQIIVGALIGGIVVSCFYHGEISALKLAQKVALEDQRDADKKKCDADKAITTEVSHDYESQISALNHQLSALKRVQHPRCVPVAGASAGHHAAAGEKQPAGPTAVSADDLYTLAGIGEKYRIQLMGCQDFIRKTWKANGQ